MRVGKQAHASGLQVSVCVGGSADREAFNLIEAALLADALVIAALSNSLLANAPWAVSNTRRWNAHCRNLRIRTGRKQKLGTLDSLPFQATATQIPGARIQFVKSPRRPQTSFCFSSRPSSL